MLYNSNQKKSFFIIICSIFYYNDMEDREKVILRNFSRDLEGVEELAFACDFVKEDILSAFERAKKEVEILLNEESTSVKLQILSMVWNTTKDKGYMTTIEAKLLLELAHSWQVESELISLVKG